MPRGIIRIWYRVGLNQNYTLDPNNFRDTTLVFDYVGNDANTHTATITCSLKSTVTNASERESLESIKANAPRFFATQDRMVTADDYSIFPTTVNENILNEDKTVYITDKIRDYVPSPSDEFFTTKSGK